MYHGYNGKFWLGKFILWNIIDLAKLWGKTTILYPKGHVTGYPPSTPVNLENLFDALHPTVTPKWKLLGQVLGVDEDHIDEIFTDGETDEECLKNVLEVWIKKSSPTWKEVADTVQKIGENKLAESLYIQCKTHYS